MKKIIFILIVFCYVRANGQGVPYAPTTTRLGSVPVLPNDATKFLNGVGSFTVPAGSASVYNVKLYGTPGKMGDGVEILNAATGSSTVNTHTVTSSVATFLPTDTNKIIYIDGAGTAGRQLVSTISGYISSTQVTITDAIITSFSLTRFGYGSDCTAGIQAALNAAAAAGGGQVFIPNGLYLIGGPLQTNINGVNPNCQIYIPSPASSRDTTRASSIQVLGEGSANFIGNDVFNGTPYIPGKKGSVILSTISGSGSGAAVFGSKGPTTAFDSLNYTTVLFTDLTILVGINPTGIGPTMGGINASNISNFDGENLFISVDNTVWNMPRPTADVAGIVMPKVNCETMQVLKTTMTIGFPYGVVPGEHSSLDQVQAAACLYGFAIQNCEHSWYAAKLSAFWCRYVIGAPGINFVGVHKGPAEFNVSQLEVEQLTILNPNPGSWIDSTTILFDTAAVSEMTGNIYGYTIVESGHGPGYPITRTGAGAVENRVHATMTPGKMNQQELIGGPNQPYVISTGIAASDSAAKLEINSGVNTSTSKYYADLIQTTYQTGTSNTIGRQIMANNFIANEKRMYEMAVNTDGATNTSRAFYYLMKAGVLTATHEVGTSSFDMKLPMGLKPVAAASIASLTGMVAGDLIWNSDSLKIWKYNGSAWLSAEGGGGAGTPAGSTTQVQYNDAGFFGADANFVWDKTNLKLTVGGGTNFMKGVNAVASTATGNTGFYARNTDGSGQASLYIENNRGSLATYTGFLVGGSTNSIGNLFGVSRADKTFFFHDGASGLGMWIGTLNAEPFAVGTNNTERFRVFSGGNTVFGSTTDDGSALVQIIKTTSQLSLEYDGTHRGISTISSAGDWGFASSASTFTFTGIVEPEASVTRDLGTASLAWRDLYYSHTISESAIGASSGLGTNVTSVTPAGSDADFQLTIVSSGNVAGGVATISFGRTWIARPHCVVSAADSNTGTLIGAGGGAYIAFNATSTTQATLTGNWTGAATLVVNCHCGQ